MEFFEQPKADYLPRTQTEIQERKRVDYKLIARCRRVPGLTMWSFNRRTGEIKLAPLEEDTTVDFRTQLPTKNARIKIEKDCLYRQALNEKNFIKILVREGVLVRAAK